MVVFWTISFHPNEWYGGQSVNSDYQLKSSGKRGCHPLLPGRLYQPLEAILDPITCISIRLGSPMEIHTLREVSYTKHVEAIDKTLAFASLRKTARNVLRYLRKVRRSIFSSISTTIIGPGASQRYR